MSTAASAGAIAAAVSAAQSSSGIQTPSIPQFLLGMGLFLIVVFLAVLFSFIIRSIITHKWTRASAEDKDGS